MLFHLVHIHQDIDTEKHTVASRPGLNSGAHILYYNVHQCECKHYWRTCSVYAVVSRALR